MAYDYSEDVADVIEAVNEYGRAVQFAKSDETVDEANPLAAPAALVWSAPVMCVFVAPGGVSNLGASAAIVQLVKDCEQVAIIAPGAIDYETMTHVKDFDNSVWSLARVAKLMPGSVPVLYYLGVNRP